MIGAVMSTPNVTSLRFLTKDELAAVLGLKRRGVECLMKARRIPYVKVGGRVRFQLDRVLNALERHKVKAIRA
jgi:excisionase family DNA binding protein